MRPLAIGLGVVLLLAACGAPPPADNGPNYEPPNDVVADVPATSEAPIAPQDDSEALTADDVFGPGATTLLNEFDLGDEVTKLTVCRDLSSVLSSLSDSAIQTRTSRMADYDYSTLMDLVGECNSLAE